MAGRRVLTGQSVLKCAHMGTVALAPSQDFVRIEGESVLIDPDTVGRPVRACPMATPANPPCTKTVNADRSASFSDFVRIDGRGVCLDTATGMTNWSKLAVIPYSVISPAQDFVGIE
jgi:hypothetical protein